MERRSLRGARHLARLERREGRLESLEVVEVAEDRPRDLVDHRLRRRRRRHDGRPGAEGPDVGVLAGVRPRGNNGWAVLRVRSQQDVDARPAHLHEASAAAANGVLHDPVGALRGVDDGVHAAGAERLVLLVRCKLRHGREIGPLEPERVHEAVHRDPVARARVADVDPLAGEVRARPDARPGPHHDGERLLVCGEHAAKRRVLALLREGPATGDRVALNVRRDHREIDAALAERLDVEDRAGRALHPARKPVPGRLEVDEAADGAPERIVDAARVPGADDDGRRAPAVRTSDACTAACAR